jgi:hypothetical protein
VEEKEIGAAALRRVVELRSRGATARRKRGEGGEVVREEQGLVGALYRVRREGEGAAEVVGERSVAGGH